MRRRLLYFFAASFAALALLVATLPWWLSLALRAAPASWGIRYGSYERVGYARFALRDVEFRRAGVRVAVDRVEADTPILWWWRHQGSGDREIIAGKWSVEVEPKPPAVNRNVAANAPTGWTPLRARLQRIAGQLDRWLPRARTGSGVVRWQGGELALASATWAQRTLAVKEFSFKAIKADMVGEFPAGTNEIKLNGRMIGATDSVVVRDFGSSVSAQINWWDQRAELAAKFGPGGWLPVEAALRADDWNLPGAKLKLGEAYAQVRGHARVDWRENKFQLEVQAKGEPRPEKKAPPLEVDLRGRGDMESLVIEALRATLPGIAANLSEPVIVERSGKLRDGGAVFSVEMDLARQPWFEAQGIVKGSARVVTGTTQIPVVDFRLTAQEVAAEGLALRAVEAAGQFDWPQVRVAKGTLVGGEGERLEWAGGWDFRKKEVLAATAEGTIRRTSLERWLPAQPQFAAIAFKAQAAGPLAELSHAGNARADAVSFRGVKPLQLGLDWSGRAAAIEKFSLTASAAATRLAADGAVDRDGLKLTGLKLEQGGEERLRLSQPATVRWRPVLEISGLHLTGPQGGLDAALTWGATGEVQLALHNISSTWLSDLVALPGPAWELTSVALKGAWDKGPMSFSATAGAAIGLGSGRKAVVNLAGRGDKNGIHLESLRAAEGVDSIINATGTVPVVISPGAQTLLTIDRDAALSVDAATAPNAAFWQELAALTGFELKEPRVAAHVRGTWSHPKGDVTLQSERIAFDAKRFPRALPTVEALDIAVVGTDQGINLERFSLQVEGQAVRASGRLPVNEAGWTNLFKEPLGFAQRGADVRLEIPDADVAVFSRYLPAMLAPKGRLHVDVNYKAGAMDGNLTLSGASTRPLGPLGVLQEIEADVRLAGRTVEIKSVAAKSGGQDVRLSGKVELPEFKFARTDASTPASASAPTPQPKYDVRLQGGNLPLVRRSGLLVRADLDLKLQTPDRGPPQLIGKVKLRDSLFLQDVRALRPSGTHSVSRRPPYFSIDTPPLDAWRLDVMVEGDEFMRMRTTLFNGVASAHFRLTGSLAEPQAIGEATVEEGRIRLPFASFEVQEGRVTLSREQPYEPQLAVVATTRRLSYDLRMEVTGTANAPVVAFSSSPPLEHGQILLMVTAGESPQSEVAYSDRQRAQQLGMFIGRSLFASLGGEADAADRVTVTTGEKVSRAGKETLEAEVKLTKRWSLTAEYPDEFDEKNVGVKVRVYTKGGRDDAVTAKTHESDQP